MLNASLDFQSYCYSNRTQHIQIIRSNIQSWYLERAVFPHQQFCFNAPTEAQLEIYTNSNISMILSDRLLCKNLQSKKS